MSIQIFLNEENLNMLWDLIVSEDIFKFLTKDNQKSVLKLFIENTKGFYETEKIKTTTLIDMNKKYILLILNHIKKNYHYNIHSKIKINKDSEKK